jgi:hypothetical protein
MVLYKHMQQLKVRKKDTLILNVLIYLTLSFFFLYLQHAYRHHLSPFSLVYFRKGFELFWYVALTLSLSAVLIWKHHSRSLFMYQLSIFLVSFKVVEGLFIEFNKIIVVAMFFYSIISYFLYQLLKHYLGLASINPNFMPSDLFRPLLRDIPCRINWNDKQAAGTLSNWDDEGCFIKLTEPTDLPSSVEVTVFFSNREFVQNGEVVASTHDLQGVGIKFGKTLKDLNVFNWSEFMEILHELGFQPERLR